MASIFKRRKGKNEPYTIQYEDHLGKRRTTIGFTDKGLSEELAAKLKKRARKADLIVGIENLKERKPAVNPMRP